MQIKKIVITASIMLTASMAMAQSTPKAIDLNKLYGRFEKPDFRH